MEDDRDSHRAAVEAGYADLREYLEAWENSNIDPNAELFEQLTADNEELKKQIRDLKLFYYEFHQDALNYMLKKDVLSGFMKYRKKRNRQLALFEED